jgi:hypothetical protein
MPDRSVHGYTVSIEQTDALGSVWVVRVYRKRFPFKKSVSTDWFLDGVQAHLFADQVVTGLENGSGLNNLRERKPGWTLQRPAH